MEKPICSLCGYEICESESYSDGISTYHKECTFKYFQGQREMGNCFCGGTISEEGFCEECGTVADDSSLDFIFDN